MRYKTRRNLFILFTLLFFVSIVPVILYTQGYRLDTQKLTLTKTGGLDLNVINSGSEVYLNGKFQRETNFIFRNAVFRNILPGDYNIEIKKDGYHAWQKTEAVKEGQVTKFTTIRLFPVELTGGILMKDVQNIFISPNEKYSIIQTPSPATTEGETTSQLTYYDLNVRLPIPLLTIQSDEVIRSVKWSPSGIFSILIDDNINSTLYTGAGAEGEVGLVNWSVFLRRSYPTAFNEDAIVLPDNSRDVIYVMTLEEDDTYSLNRVELTQGIIRPDIVTGILGFTIADENMFYLDELGSLKRTNISGRDTVEITPTAISNPRKDLTKIIVRGDRRAIAVINSGALFIWQEDQPLEKADDGVINASFSPDNNKILYTKKDEAAIYWTEDVFGPPKHLIGDIERVPFENINNAAWVGYESNHIVLQSPTSIMFTELDERGGRNTAEYNVLTEESGVFASNLERQEVYTLLPDKNFVFLKYE
ncbi:MAG: PEGA domain-containing protein [Candidatus Spechtbacterales bacterium]